MYVSSVTFEFTDKSINICDLPECCRRYEVKDLPDSEEELSEWLRNLFKEKVYTCILIMKLLTIMKL